MKVLNVLLLLAFVCSTFAAVSVKFSGNLTTDQTNGISSADLSVRVTKAWKFGGVGVNTAGYVSHSISASANNASFNASSNTIVGVISFITTTFPTTLYGYIKQNLNLGVGTNLINVDFSISGGFVASSFVRIEERAPDGSVKRTVPLKNLIFVTENGEAETHLSYISMSATSGLNLLNLKSGEEIRFTFVISEVLGVVQFGSVTAPVTPKTLESFIEINNWKYQSSSNYLVIVGGVLTGSAEGASSGKVSLASGSGENQVYVNFASTVDINGANFPVTVTKTKTANLEAVIDNVAFRAHASSVYKGSVSATLIEVQLPAGASKILYDPTIGSGEPLNGVVQTIISFIFIAVAVLLF